MSNSYKSNTFDFEEKLLQMRNDKSLLVTNSRDMEKKAEEGATIVLKGSPRFILIMWPIFLLIIGIMISVWVFGFSFFDLNTFLLIMSVWVGTGILFLIGTMSNLLILHHEGFLMRRFIFFKFSRKWKNLTVPPRMVIKSGSQGDKWYNIVFTTTSRQRRMNVAHMKLTDTRKPKHKLESIGNIVAKLYEKATK